MTTGSLTSFRERLSLVDTQSKGPCGNNFTFFTRPVPSSSADAQSHNPRNSLLCLWLCSILPYGRTKSNGTLAAKNVKLFPREPLVDEISGNITRKPDIRLIRWCTDYRRPEIVGGRRQAAPSDFFVYSRLNVSSV